MTHKDARALARFIQETQGCACTVPNGHGPDQYFARIGTTHTDDFEPGKSIACHPVDFYSWKEAWGWFEKARECEEEWRRQIYAPQRRSPLDILIDRAVGRE